MKPALGNQVNALSLKEALMSAPRFNLSASFVKTANEWRGLSRRKSVEGAAKAFAKANMVAIIHRADDSAVGFFYDVANDRVAKVTYSNVEWAA